jgi:glucose-6-phosphate 1-dehydrogenase
MAYKQIFPALAALVKRGVLGGPIIGVARAGWTEEQFVERARRSLEDHRMLDEASLARRDPCGPRHPGARQGRPRRDARA